MQENEIPYWKQLDEAISLSLALGIESNNEFDFEDVSKESWNKTYQQITKFYNHIIELRDEQKIPRSHTVFDCGGMTVTLHDLLAQQGISSLVVVGDIFYKNQAFYNANINEMLSELDPSTRKSSVNSHAWLMLSNYMIVDMTLRIKKDLNRTFIEGSTYGEPLIFDAENPPIDYVYQPMLVGTNYLAIIN